MRSQYDMHVRNCIAWAIAPARDGRFKRLQRFVAVAACSVERSDEVIRWRRIRFYLDRAIKFRFGPIEVPVEYAFCLGEVYVCFRLFVVQLQSANSGLSDFWIRFEWRCISVREPQP